ncbi:MAG: flagellar basal body P-ring formation chaperone FlgA [Hyphomicrobiales bacterium]
MKSPKVKLVACLMTVAAFAASSNINAASLKKNVTVYSTVVVAGDLFEGLDEYQDEPLFLAPDIGKSGKISAYRVAEEAHDIGIYELELNGIKSVTVNRPSIIVNSDEAKQQLRHYISDQMSEKIDFEITTSSIPTRVHTDPRAETALSINNFVFNKNDKRFQTTLSYSGHNGIRDVPVRGVLTEMASVITLTRDLGREDVITEGDLVVTRLPKEKVRASSLTSPSPAVGMATVRNLSQGSVLRNHDFAPPLLVRSNDPVAITYSVPGLLLTAQGRALSDGSKDAVVSIRNLQSNRVVRGRVTDIGEVLVVPRKPFFAANQQTSQTEVQ